MTAYARQLRSILSQSERNVLRAISSPKEIQNYLDTLPINFELTGETYMSSRRVIREQRAHCIEGAMFAASALAYHGARPLLLDFVTIPEDECHVVALFQQNGYWGAISKTNHSILRYRDPVYRTVRELAMSYVHEYLTWSGQKSVRAYSAPFDLSRFSPDQWVTAEQNLEWVVEKLDKSRHFPLVPKENIKHLRKASEIELRAMKLTDWQSSK